MNDQPPTHDDKYPHLDRAGLLALVDRKDAELIRKDSMIEASLAALTLPA